MEFSPARNDAAAPGAIDRDAHGLALEEPRGLSELAHEHERARALEELLRGVGELEKEPGGGANGVADVAQDDQLGAVAAAAGPHDLAGDAAGPHRSAKRAVRIDATEVSPAGANARGPPQSLGEAAHGAAHVVDLVHR